MSITFPTRPEIAAILNAALAAVDPDAAVRAQLRRQGDSLQAGDRHYDLGQFEHVYVIGAGKAGAPMALAAEPVLGHRITAGGWSTSSTATWPNCAASN